MVSIFGVFGVAVFFAASTGLSLFDPLFWQLIRDPKVSTQHAAIFNNREVKAGQPQPWATAPKLSFYAPLSVQEQSTEQSKIDQLVNEAGSEGLTSLLVIQNGVLTYEKYFREYGWETRQASMSVSKSVVSLLTGIALNQGKIKSLDDKVADYVSELVKDPRGKISIRQLLNMTSGLEKINVSSNPLTQLQGSDLRLYAGNDLLQAVKKTPMTYRPGQRWQYSNAATALLGIVVAKATGQHLSDYFSQQLWQPLGAEQSALWNLDRAGGQEKGFLGLYITARDYARLGQLVLQQGQWQGQQLVPASYLKEAFSSQTDQNGGVDYYGYSFWLRYNTLDYGSLKNNPSGENTFGDGLLAEEINPVTIRPKRNIISFEGYLGQYISIFPKTNTVIVALNESDEYDDVSWPLILQIDQLLRQSQIK